MKLHPVFSILRPSVMGRVLLGKPALFVGTPIVKKTGEEEKQKEESLLARQRQSDQGQRHTYMGAL